MNRGALDLGEKLRRLPFGTKKALAGELGIDPPTLSHWLADRGKPNTRQRVFIQERFGIAILSWDESAPDPRTSDPTEAA